MHVANILTVKGDDVITVTPETTIVEVAKILKAKRIGALLVMEGSNIAGIIRARYCPRTPRLRRENPQYAGFRTHDEESNDLLTR